MLLKDYNNFKARINRVEVYDKRYWENVCKPIVIELHPLASPEELKIILEEDYAKHRKLCSSRLVVQAGLPPIDSLLTQEDIYK